MKYGKEIFVSGIDTDCGKTFITGHLAFHFQKNNIPTITTKLVQTGREGISDDIITHRGIMEVGLFDEDKSKLTCPNIYSFAASPHLASELDKKPIDLKTFRKNTENLLDEYKIILSEGAGGLMVPLKPEFLVIDYIKKYKIPVVLVSSSKLGSINHTLMSISVCQKYDINLIAVIYNRLPDSDETISNDSYKIIEKYLDQHKEDCHLIDGNILNKSNEKAFESIEFLLEQ